MAHIPGLYLKPESFSPSYGRKKMTDTQIAIASCALRMYVLC